MIAVFRWFGNPEAMQIQTPEDFARVPGLTLEDANALVRLGMERRACRASCGTLDERKPETSPPVPAAAEPVAPAAPLLRVADTVERVGAATPAAARAPVKPPGAAFPAKAELPGPPTLPRVFRNGRMWFMDPRIKKIVSEAPP